MKFTLTYDGELRSNGRPREKWKIRKALHPQLEELWQIDPTLRQIHEDRYWPKGGAQLIDFHHTEPDPPTDPAVLSEQEAIRLRREHNPDGFTDLCVPIERGGHLFNPLVRDSFLLKCGLKIIFLRKEPPGKLYQGGDMDNRLKTFFDALAVPPHKDHVVVDSDAPNPMHTLLEDDSAITKLEIETHQLLSRPGASSHEVRLVVEVDVRVAQARAYNHMFLST